jgi:hypothetical protein
LQAAATGRLWRHVTAAGSGRARPPEHRTRDHDSDVPGCGSGGGREFASRGRRGFVLVTEYDLKAGRRGGLPQKKMPGA